jgi:hypothetical protein
VHQASDTSELPTIDGTALEAAHLLDKIAAERAKGATGTYIAASGP